MNNSTQKEVRVKVNYGPDGTCDDVSSLQTFTEGNSTASIRCFSECYPSCSYIWSNGSSQLSNSEILFLSSVRRYQAGNYTFAVSNTAQTYTKSILKIFTVVVRYAPAVSIVLSTMNHSEGTSLTLFCRGEGVPPTYTYTGLTQIVGDVQVPNLNTALSGTETYSSIHFSKLQLQDTGNYTCKMNNGILDLNRILDQTESVQFLVEVQPKILEIDLKYAGAQSNPVTVQVPFYCYPAVQSVTFVRYDGTIIQKGPKYSTSFMPSKVHDNFYGKEVALDGYIAVLTINDLEEGDFVNYTLAVHNSRGTTSELIFIVAEKNSSPVVAGAVGGSVSAIVAIAVAVGVVVWRRRVGNIASGTEQETQTRQKQFSENSYYNLQSLQEGQSTYCDLMKTDTNERSNYSDLNLYERSIEVSAYGKLADADERDRNRTYASLCPETREPTTTEGHDKTYVNLVVKK